MSVQGEEKIMVSLQSVEEQLKRLGCNFKFWGRAEIKELSVVLMPDEVIAQCTNGHYEGGFALLAATDRRLLLIDRKPMFLTLEAISYDMISELDFSHRLLDSTIRIFTFNKSLVFTTWNHKRLRTILTYSQHRMADIRQQYMSQVMQQQPQQQQSPHQLQPAYGSAQASTPAPAAFNGIDPMQLQSPWNYNRKTPMLSRRRGWIR
jgi:hypothetical protein